MTVGNCFYIPCCQNHVVLVFDMDTCIGRPVRVGQSGNRYNSICRDGTAMWLVPRPPSGNLVRWDLKKQTQQEFPLFKADGKVDFYIFCAVRKDKLLLYALQTPVLQFSPQTGRLEPLEKEPVVHGYECARQIGGDIYALAAARCV